MLKAGRYLVRADPIEEASTVSIRLISIIGPPAVGKTTLGESLAAQLPAKLIREDYAGNPFLADAYAGLSEAALPAQLYYLMSRIQQLSRSQLPREGLVVSDYGFCQDRIYARRQLSGEDWALYDGLARRLEALVHPPELMLYLDASPETLLRRIALRGRDFEKVIDKTFLESMRRAYNEFVAHADCEVTRIDSEAVDLRDARVSAELAAGIRNKRWK